MRSVRVLIIMVAALALAACGSSKKNNDVQNTPPPGTSTFLASGGTGTSGPGGGGGYVYVRSYGAVKVLKSGTVDASFDSLVTLPAPSFGTNPYIVSGGTTTVQVNADDPALGNLCTVTGNPNIYIGNGDGTCDAGSNDTMVTGLTIDAGATLVLVDQGYCGGPICGGYAALQLSNDLVINGTLTTDVNTTSGLYIESNIDVETGGRITTSATTDGSKAGAIYLGYGNNITKTIINRGTIEAKGLGTGSGGYLYFDAEDLIVNSGMIDASGGSSAAGFGGNANEIDIFLNSAKNGKFYSSGTGTLLAKGGDSSDSNSGGYGGTGGYIYIDVPELVVNNGTIDVSGGNSDADAGGSGGELDVYVGYGDFHSSGTVRMNGGNGATTGGHTEAWAGNWWSYSAYIETVYSNNDRGTNGDIVISGTWEANGGNGANGAGGIGGDIYLQTDAMGNVTINSIMSARGGNSSEATFSGGNAAYGIDVYSYNYHTDPANPGKIRIAGQYDLRGGNGDAMGGSGGYLNINSNGYNASGVGSDVELVGFPTLIMNGGDGANGGSANSGAFQLSTNFPGVMPAGPVTNEANIEAKGGNGAATTGSAGGTGGYVQMGISGIGDPAEVINNSGSIDVSGGTGDAGGPGYTINLQARHVTNSGNLSANGGTGTAAGGGGNITLTSSTPPTTNTGILSATGGGGTKTIDGTVIP